MRMVESVVLLLIALSLPVRASTGYQTNVPLAHLKNVNSTAQLCYADAYRYHYCVFPATCDSTTKFCSGKFAKCANNLDASPMQLGFTKPVLVPEKLASLFMIWGVVVVSFGLCTVFLLRNKQPLRSTNYFLVIVEILIQLFFIRLDMYQQETDPCFLSNSVIVIYSLVRYTLFLQVRKSLLANTLDDDS
jgi:hypothetical protein